MADASGSGASQPRVRTFSVTYACGVIDIASGFHPPMLGGSPRPHVCAWKAGGVLCEITAWREAVARPMTNAKEPT